MYKVMIQNSGGLWIEWPGNYKKEKHAEQAANRLKKKFKEPFWRAYYKDITPKVIKK